jgi:hypothetical protein
MRKSAALEEGYAAGEVLATRQVSPEQLTSRLRLYGQFVG